MDFSEVNNPHSINTSPLGREFRTSAIERIKGSIRWFENNDGSYYHKYMYRVLIIYLDNGDKKWLVFNHRDKLIETKNFE